MFWTMCGVAGNRRTSDLSVTGLGPPLATKHYTLYAVGQ